MRLPKKLTKFTYREWYFTNEEENLFTLTREELFIYRAIIRSVK